MGQLWAQGADSGGARMSRGTPPRRRSGQASFEAIAVLSLLFVILLPVIVVLYSYVGKTANSMRNTQLDVIGNDILSAAETTYYLGSPSRLTLEETFPAGITNLSILGGRELVFTMQDAGEIVFFSDVPLEGTFSKEHFSPGDKSILLEATPLGNVSVTIS